MRTPSSLYTFVLLALIFHSVVFGQTNCPVPDAGPDLLICEPGQPVQINASINGNYDRFRWEPTRGLNPSNSLNPTVTVNQTTTYKLIVESKSDINLIENGDFAAGNSGFSSEYIYIPPGQPFSGWGVYSVHSDPSAFNGGFSNCPDVTGEGLMFISDAALNPGVRFWCQTVAVQPNTNYEFSFWATSIYPVSPPSFQVFFNGTPGGGPFPLSSTPCNWQRFTTTWNSGGATSVEICMEDLNVELGGNDFALDDIRLLELCEEEDEVTIEVVEMLADPGGPYSLTCDFPVIQLDGSLSSQGAGYIYLWTTPNGNIRNGANTLYPIVDRPGTYLLTVYGPGGCEKTVPVEVVGNINPPEVTILPADSIGCGTDSIRLSSVVIPRNQGYNYNWNGPGGFSSGDDNPWVTSPGVYYVEVVDVYGCKGVDSVTVETGPGVPALRPLSNDTLDCNTDSVRLSVDPLVQGQNYEWTGPNGFSSTEPETMAGDTGWYYITTWEDPECPAMDSIFVKGDYLTLPVALEADTLNCLKDSVNVRAKLDTTGIMSWEWKRPDGSSSLDTTLSTPFKGWHELYTTYENGCVHIDSIRVEADSTLPVFTLASDTITCARPTAVVEALPSPDALGVSWTGPGAFSSEKIKDTVSLPGWYFATVTGPNGCQATDSVLVERSGDVPVIDLLSDTLDCNNSQLALQWNSPDTGLVFNWSGPGGFSSSAPNPMISEPGNYQLVLTNAQNCQVIDSVTISEDVSQPVFTITTDSIDCNNTTANIALNAVNGASSIQWLDSSGNVLASGTDFSTTSGGNYTVRVTGSNGCEKDTSLTIKEDKAVPNISLSGDTIDCRKTEVWIQLQIDPAEGSGQWNGPGILQENTDSVLVNEGGIYAFTFTGDNGCMTSEQITIEVDTTNPVFSLQGDSLLFCLQQQVAISLMGQQVGWTNTWTDENGNALGTNPDLIVDEPGTYSVRVVDPVTGCDGEKSWTVREILPPDDMEITTERPGCTSTRGTVSVLSITGGQGPYEITVNGSSVSQGEEFSLEPGTYQAEVIDALGCSYQESFTINNRVTPVLTLISSIDVVPGQSVILRPTINIDSSALASIQWTPAGKVSCPNCLVTLATPDVSERYILTVTDTSGCTATASVLLNLKSSDFFIPNAFTPFNEDGINDFFLPNTGNGILVESMQIFDRWGSLLWSKDDLMPNDPTEGWDGSSGDKDVLPGTYVYRISIRLPDGELVYRSGDVTILD